jgi:hypothetical protein
MKALQSPWKISGIAGILFVALSFLASGINKMPPMYNQEISAFARWFSENGEWYRFGHVLAGLAFLLFYFPFFAGFCEILKKAEGEPSLWTKVTWAGAIISPAAGTVAGAFVMVTFIENIPPGVLATINGLAWLAYFLWIALLSIELIRIPDVETRK